jgi:mRNA-degrading endonuclease YafQ of YafQ-DinJ toxin-antitoxin module
MGNKTKNRPPAPAANPNREWGFTYSPLFESSLRENIRIFPDLPAKMERFITLKKDNPFTTPFGRSDRPMTGPLAGLWHCHLFDDAVLIYRLKDRCVHCVCIVTHADMEGKRQKTTVHRLKTAGELPEGLADRIIQDVMVALRG